MNELIPQERRVTLTTPEKKEKYTAVNNTNSINIVIWLFDEETMDNFSTDLVANLETKLETSESEADQDSLIDQIRLYKRKNLTYMKTSDMNVKKYDEDGYEIREFAFFYDEDISSIVAIGHTTLVNDMKTWESLAQEEGETFVGKQLDIEMVGKKKGKKYLLFDVKKSS